MRKACLGSVVPFPPGELGEATEHGSAHRPPSIGNVPAAVDYPSSFGPADAKNAESARQSARLDPNVRKKFDAGAGDRNRTRNLLFTKQLLCQLSYAGVDTKRSGSLSVFR